MRKFSTPPDDLSSEKWKLLELRLKQKGIIPATSAQETIPKRDENGPCSLSFAQQRLWFLDQLQPASSAYIVAQALYLRGDLSQKVLARSLEALVQRHESLRTTFAMQEDRPVQVIHEVSGREQEWGQALPVIDVRGLRPEQREAIAHWLAEQEAQCPFDLVRGPLLRAYLLWAEEQAYVFLLTMHHIVSDAWSRLIFVRELVTLYRAFAAGQPAPLPDLPIQYGDYAVWQRHWLQGEVLEQQVRYWSEQLVEVPALELPTDFPRPPVQRLHGRCVSHTWPSELSTALRKLARQEGVTLFMLLLAAFQTLLARYSGQQTFAVGTLVANRTRLECEGLIGFFVNILVLRADLSGQPTFRRLLAQVREVALGAYAHQDVPFEHLVDVLQPERDMSRSPLCQVLFQVQNLDRSIQETDLLPGLTLHPLQVEGTTSKFDLSCHVVESQQGLHCVLEYNTDLFAPATIERMQTHFQTLLEGVVQDPQTRISDLPMLTEAEREQLLVAWNDTKTDYQGFNPW